MHPQRSFLCLVLTLSVTSPAPAGPARIVLLGDSITRGVRPGVKLSETFGAILEADAKAMGIDVEVVNVGIGGERTDQALKRLERDVLSRKPDIVTIMYGTNDSYVDQGKSESRLSLPAYSENLVLLVVQLRKAGVTPILMTEPRWAADATPNGAGENPNVRLEKYVAACREVARKYEVHLVDHFANWTEAGKKVNLREWTTDGCHPNPRGHRELASLLLPVVAKTLEKPLVATPSTGD